MTYIIFFTAIVLGCFCRKNKVVTVYMMAVMFILAVYKYNCADLDNYELSYLYTVNGNLTQGKYLGHYFIGKICAILGCSFLQYLQIYYALCMLILYKGISSFTKNVNFVLGCYMIYSYGIDVIQMKTMLADSIILLALFFLFKSKIEENKSKEYFLKFVVCMLISCTIHFMSVFIFGVGILYYLSEYQKFRKYISVFLPISFVLLYTDIVPKLLVLVGNYMPIFDSVYVLRWFERRINWGWIFPVMLCLMIIFFTIQMDRVLNKYEKNEIVEFSNEINKFIYSIIISLPFFLYNTTFVRLFRVYVILLVILVARLMINRRKMLKSQFLLYICLGIIIFSLFVYEIFPVYDTTLGAVLKYNLHL